MTGPKTRPKASRHEGEGKREAKRSRFLQSKKNKPQIDCQALRLLSHAEIGRGAPRRDRLSPVACRLSYGRARVPTRRMGTDATNPVFYLTETTKNLVFPAAFLWYARGVTSRKETGMSVRVEEQKNTGCETCRPCRKLVGERGFEPLTFWSRTKRATRLRYSPFGEKRALSYHIQRGCQAR